MGKKNELIAQRSSSTDQARLKAFKILTSGHRYEQNKTHKKRRKAEGELEESCTTVSVPNICVTRLVHLSYMS